MYTVQKINEITKHNAFFVRLNNIFFNKIMMTTRQRSK